MLLFRGAFMMTFTGKNQRDPSEVSAKETYNRVCQRGLRAKGSLLL